MESPGNISMPPSRIGDRSTSDVVVRLRTQDGRDEWVYCHSHILIEKSKYFADRLSENWPTCQILDSRNCVEVYCHESAFDYHVTALRLFYVVDCAVTDMWHGVKNALGILRVAMELGCPQIVAACVEYLEAVPWEEAEEEEILKKVPGMGSQVEAILARLQPVNPTAIKKMFLSAIRFATSSPSSTMNDLKTSAQEQLEYMLTEDDDVPLVVVDDEIKLEVKECIKKLFDRFDSLVLFILSETRDSVCDAGTRRLLKSYLTDLSWACQIVGKLEIMREIVSSWVESSVNVVKVVEQVCQETDMLETKLKVVEVTAKVLDAIGYGTVILPTAKRLHMVKVWLPFVRVIRPLLESAKSDGEDGSTLKLDGDLWQFLESSFVSIIIALPSGNQAEILTEWLGDKRIRYPDLTEAFEVWCYRSKVANKRLALLGCTNGMAKMV